MLLNPFKMRLFSILVLLLFSSVLYGQNNTNIPVGTWRTQLPTTSVSTIALNQNKLYCASVISSFTLDTDDGYLSPLSKIDGLTESDITVIRYNEKTNIGIIGYQSGNIDIIINGNLNNFNAILQSNIQGSKKINGISIYNQIAFISCDFGVLLIDLVKIEVKESWLSLNVNGLPNKIYGCTLNDSQDSVFLATQIGLLSAPYYTPNNPGLNLMDFTSWQIINPVPSQSVSSVASLNGSIYCAISNAGLFVQNGTIWQNVNLPSFNTSNLCYNLNYSNNSLVLSAQGQVYIISSPTTITLISGSGGGFSNVQDAIYDHSGNLWLGDANNGLIKLLNGKLLNYSLNGPLSPSAFSIYYYNNTILVNAGGYNQTTFLSNYNYNGFFELQNQESWVNYNQYSPGFPDSLFDNVISKYNPYDDTLYMGFFGTGLLCWIKSTGSYVVHDRTNSPLQSNNITGLDIDSLGNIWIATFSPYDGNVNVSGLYSKNKQGVWKSYAPRYSTNGDLTNTCPLQIKIDQSGNKWLRYGSNSTGRGIDVYNEKQNLNRNFTTSATDGLPSQNVYCMDIDKSGNIWVGTDKGIAGFYSTNQAFSGAFTTPIYNGYPVLFQSIVNCIKTDAANRKWVGTTDGLWLFNSDFTQQLLSFNTSNSPLYSNNILALEIHDLTGELFIATDLGLISYRADATADNSNFSSAKIFPNPVSPGYNGVIAIEGLMNNASVKITDMQGKLFYETKANGGTATWNLINYAGIRAQTGMYLVFVSTSAGDQKYVGKIAIIE